MGIGSSKESTYEVEGLNHPKMKHVKFAKNKEIMNVSMGIEDELQFYKWENKLAKLQKFDEYYLLLPKAYQFSKKGVCGSSGLLNVEYDNYPYLLHQEIQKRAMATNYFNETQLWYLLYGLVSAANIFKEVGTKVGDIQAKNIFLNEEGQIKISNLCSWPGERTNYQKLIFEQLATYVSPEQLGLSSEGRVDIFKGSPSTGKAGKEKIRKLDQYLCESFSIGLTMLETCLLKKSSSLYSEKKFDEGQLNIRITQVLRNEGKTKYSKALRMAIASLCEVQPSDRLDACQLYQHLKYHDSEIINLKPCNVEIIKCSNKQKYDSIMTYSTKGQHNSNAISPVSSTQNYTTNIVSWNNNYTNAVGNSCNSSFPPIGHSNYGYHFPLPTPNYQSYGNTFGPTNFGYPSIYREGEASYIPTTYGSTWQAKEKTPEVRAACSPGSLTSYSTYATHHLGHRHNNAEGKHEIANRDLYSSTGVNQNNGRTQLNIQTTVQVRGNIQYGGLSKQLQNEQIGSGNSYLHSIYSTQSAQLTPTFNTGVNLNNAIASTNSQQQPRRNEKENGEEKQETQLPTSKKVQATPNNATPISYHTSLNTNTDPYAFSNPSHITTQNTLSGYAHLSKPPINKEIESKPCDAGSTNPNAGTKQKEINLNTNSHVYSFSNISSIPKTQYESANKLTNHTNIAAFTPSRTGIGNTNNKNDDSGLDLLKKINEEIMSSQSKFLLPP